MAKRLLLRDGENFSQDMVQRILGSLYANLPAISGVGTGYSTYSVGSRPTTSTGHLAVTANGTTLQLTILPGWAAGVRDAGGTSFDPRVLFAESDANDTSVMLTSNATGSTRNDTICMKIDMNTQPTTDGANLVSFVAIAGQSGGAVSNAPADGNIYIPLANVAVANGATSVSQGNVTDLRQAFNALGLLGTSLSKFLLAPSFGGTPAATSYSTVPVKITETVLGAAAATVTFSSIPQLYRVLVGNFHVRTDNASAQFLGAQVNGDTTAANYRYAGHTVTTGAVAAVIAATSAAWGLTLGAGAGTGVAGTVAWGNGTFRIPFYTDATSFKGCTAQCQRDDASVVGSQYTSSEWFNATTAALTQLAFLMAAGNLLAGSFISLGGEG